MMLFNSKDTNKQNKREAINYKKLLLDYLKTCNSKRMLTIKY